MGQVRLGELTATGAGLQAPPVYYPSQPARLPALRTGGHMLRLFGLHDPAEDPAPGPFTGCCFTFGDVVLCSGSGVLALPDGRIVTDTVDHTRPDADGYALSPAGDILLPAPQRSLRGRWLSLVLGGISNLFHLLLLNLSRLAFVDGAARATLDGILLPADLPPFAIAAAERLLDHAFPHRRPTVLALGPGDSVRVETLLLPWHTASALGCHPQAVALLREAMAPWRDGPAPGLPDVLYIDRRGAAMRPLENEDALVAALEARGVVPVRLETLSFDRQVRLFANARLVVAPHGAGLTHLAFARPGTRVLEIMPHSLASWCYRHLCQAAALDYDVVVSRSATGDPLLAGAMPHVVSVTHVLAALEAMQNLGQNPGQNPG